MKIFLKIFILIISLSFFLFGCTETYTYELVNKNTDVINSNYSSESFNNFSFITSDYYTYESTVPENYYASENTTSSHTQSVETTNESNSELTVYITESGKKYHRITCGSLWNSAYSTTPNEAWEMGYAPCLKCLPPFPDAFNE